MEQGIQLLTLLQVMQYKVVSWQLRFYVITCVTYISTWWLSITTIQFTSWVADIVCLLVSLATAQLLACVFLGICSGDVSPLWSCNYPDKEQLSGCCGVCSYAVHCKCWRHDVHTSTIVLWSVWVLTDDENNRYKKESPTSIKRNNTTLSPPIIVFRLHQFDNPNTTSINCFIHTQVSLLI